jgi:hypothetical protein
MGVLINSYYLLHLISYSCRLLTLYYFPLCLFFGIRDIMISDAISLTSPVIRYPCMNTCRSSGSTLI